MFHLSLNNREKERRYYVKIIMGESQGNSKTIYHNQDLPFDTFLKFNWYFKYREALLRVQHPKYYIRLAAGDYEFILPAVEHIKRLKNLIAAKKRKTTEINRRISVTRKQWRELFPLEEYDNYKKAVTKLEHLAKIIQMLEQELASLEH
jgi:hypothetical protein